MAKGAFTYTSVLFSVIVRTDSFRIRCVDGRRWHHLYFCSLLYHRLNGSFQVSFGQWQMVASLIVLFSFLSLFKDLFWLWLAVTSLISLFLSLSLIERVVSEFIRSIIGWGVSYTSDFFSVIDRMDLFRIHSVNGKLCIHLYFCSLLCYW